MANTLASFLVGVGLDFDNKGAKQAVSSLDSIRSTALQAGAAVAGAFGARQVSLGLAEQTRGYTLLAEQIGSTANNVFALDRAYQRAGGGAGAIIGQLERLKEMQAGLQVSDVGWIEAAAKAGIDVGGIINIDDPAKVFENLISQLEGMSTNQRINAINALGLDPTAINIAQDGVASLREQLDKALDRREITEQLKQDSEELATYWFDFKDNVGGVADAIGSQLIPVLSDVLGFTNEIFDLFREGFTVGEIVDETNAGGRLSAEAIVGKDAAWMDQSIGDATAKGGIWSAESIFGKGTIGEFLDRPLSELFSGQQYSPEEMEAMSRDMMTRVPSFEPTVINPAQVAPLSQPAQQAEAVATQAQAQQSSVGYNYMQQRPVVNNIYLEGRMIKQVVNQAIDENAEQAVRDVRSPIDR